MLYTVVMCHRNSIVSFAMGCCALLAQPAKGEAPVVDVFAKPQPVNCIDAQEHAEITRRHTELGVQETRMGCKELVAFNQSIYLEKRELHRQTVESGLSVESYTQQLEELERKEKAYLDETSELRERCNVPFQKRMALKREVVTRGRCSLVPK